MNASTWHTSRRATDRSVGVPTQGARVLAAVSPAGLKAGDGLARARNSCHRCGATAYKTLMERDEKGAMSPSGQYQCVQCRQVFSHVAQWRDGIV